MTVEEFKRIKDKVDQCKTEKAIAENRVKDIIQKWKENYDINSLEEAESYLLKLEEEIAKDEEKIEKLTDQLESIFNE